MGAPAGYAETTVEAWKQRALASEKRASEAERTFADLRNLIAVNLAANAELQRERDEALKFLTLEDDDDVLNSMPNHPKFGSVYVIRRSWADAMEVRRNSYRKQRDEAISQRDEAVRRAEEAETSLKLKSELYHQACDEYEVELKAAQSERDEASAALGKVAEALRAIIACDDSADYGNLCDLDNGAPGECSPSRSEGLRAAMVLARNALISYEGMMGKKDSWRSCSTRFLQQRGRFHE